MCGSLFAPKPTPPPAPPPPPPALLPDVPEPEPVKPTIGRVKNSSSTKASLKIRRTSSPQGAVASAGGAGLNTQV